MIDASKVGIAAAQLMEDLERVQAELMQSLSAMLSRKERARCPLPRLNHRSSGRGGEMYVLCLPSCRILQGAVPTISKPAPTIA
jgi:hypothetical protein